MEESHFNKEHSIKNRARIVSIDALRGFDMIWILGAQGIFAGLFALTAWPVFNQLEQQMLHSQWHGITAYDLIFPLFIFLSGLSIGLTGQSLSTLPKEKQVVMKAKLAKRLVLLCILGVVYNHAWGHGIPANFDQIRFASVLARIGIAGSIATLLVWYCSCRTQHIVLVGLLLGYWLILEFVVIGQYGGGDYSAQRALNIWFDQTLLPGATYQNASVDPEGILSNLGSIANALAGVFVGRFFIQRYSQQKPYCLMLIFYGLFALILGYGLSAVQPINKTLWTSTFAIVTIGYSILLFVIFHYLFDKVGSNPLGKGLSVIGMNAIVVYLASALIDWQYVASSLFGGLIDAMPQAWQSLLMVVALVSVQWAILYFLYQRKIFIKL